MATVAFWAVFVLAAIDFVMTVAVFLLAFLSSGNMKLANPMILPASIGIYGFILVVGRYLGII